MNLIFTLDISRPNSISYELLILASFIPVCSLNSSRNFVHKKHLYSSRISYHIPSIEPHTDHSAQTVPLVSLK